MTISKQDVAKIARLARIAVAEDDMERTAGEISGILQWIEQLGEVDTQGVPQMVSVSDLKLPWRADEVTDGNQAVAVVKNAPGNDYSCFVVPKVIE